MAPKSANTVRFGSFELDLRLTPQEHSRLANRPPVNPEAYQAYLKGSYYLEKRPGDDIRKAIASFQHAIEIDPDYAMGYAGLAESYWLAGGYGVLTNEESDSKAEAVAGKRSNWTTRSPHLTPCSQK